MKRVLKPPLCSYQLGWRAAGNKNTTHIETIKRIVGGPLVQQLFYSHRDKKSNCWRAKFASIKPTDDEFRGGYFRLVDYQ